MLRASFESQHKHLSTEFYVRWQALRNGASVRLATVAEEHILEVVYFYGIQVLI